MIELYHELEKYTDASCIKSILQEHPEVEILWERREDFQKPLVINGEDPLLHVLFEAIVEKQIQASDPPEVRQALERMLKLDFPRSVARGAIVKLFRWYLDSANRDSNAADAAGTAGYLQKLNFLGQNPGETKRNQPCPCLSGKKFKKCCLPLSKLLEINPTEGELHLGASAYFNPHFQDVEADSIYTEKENRSHFSRFLESTGDLETALLYLQENIKATDKKPNQNQFQENALKELLFFCTQHPEYAALGLETAERLINLPGVDSAEIGRCRCDQADLLAALHGLTRGIEGYDLLKQERPGYHYADFRRADLLQRFGQTETALGLLRDIEAHGDSVEPEVRTAVAELLRKIKPQLNPFKPAELGDENG